MFLLYKRNREEFSEESFLQARLKSAVVALRCNIGVLGLARTGLIFHQNPGRGTAGWADPTPTWPDRAGYSIPCAVMLGSGGGGGAAGTHSRLRSTQRWCGLRERVCCAVYFVMFSPYLYHCCSCFPLFAVLLNCPYPDPPVFCLFLSILLRTTAGGGVAAWHFFCWRQPKPKQ